MLELAGSWLPGSDRCFCLLTTLWPLHAQPATPSPLSVEHRKPSDEWTHRIKSVKFDTGRQKN